MLPFTSQRHLIQIGSITIGVEAVAYLIGLAISIYLIYRGFKKNNINIKGKEFTKFAVFTLLFIYYGGKVWYEIETWQGIKSLINILNPWLNNIKTFGMFAGAIIGILIYIIWNQKMKKEPTSITFAKIVDIIAIPSALLVFILRLGCFFDGHVIGKETNVPWCVFKEGACRHPLALYLALSGLLIFFILIIFFAKEKTERNRFGKRFDGEVIRWFLLLYCFNRFLLEFLRDGGDLLYFKLSSAQGFTLLVSIYILIKLIHIYKYKVKYYYSFNFIKSKKDYDKVSKYDHLSRQIRSEKEFKIFIKTYKKDLKFLYVLSQREKTISNNILFDNMLKKYFKQNNYPKLPKLAK